MWTELLIPLGISLVVVAVFIGVYYAITGVPPGSRIIQEAPIQGDGLEQNQAKFMFFYTTWCPYCKKAQQPWASFKEMLKNRHYTYGGKQILFEEINAESDKGKAALYKIKAYPTFKLETTDKLFEMQGKPSSATFRAFLTSALGTEKVI
jgi:thiol-disulfide isomerase/thioredoxin